jgi:prepilin-type N-terminal cleavage/methylation domain-containing protein
MDAVKHSPRGDRRRGGFTLIEIMITFTVVGIGLLALALMQVQALKDGTRARHRTGASMIARDQIELVQNTAFSDTGLDVMNPVVWATPPWLANGADPNLNPGEIGVSVSQTGGAVQEIVYTVWYLVTEDDAADPDDDLRRVDVEVVWTEDGVSNNKPTRTGQPTVAVSTMIANNSR